MAAYRRVYESHHLQADCQVPGSAPEPYARQSTMGYLFNGVQVMNCGCVQRVCSYLSVWLRCSGPRVQQSPITSRASAAGWKFHTSSPRRTGRHRRRLSVRAITTLPVLEVSETAAWNPMVYDRVRHDEVLQWTPV